jgi:hypothetical protein
MLWAITSYFNPARYNSRLANFRTFRKHLGVPLLAIELSFDGSFELQALDADLLLQFAGRDVLWHKERLLNVAVRSLPPDCDEVAWIDCDLIFDTDDWPARTRDALKDFAMVQLFVDRCNLKRGARLDSPCDASFDSVAQSIGYKIATGRAEPDDLRVAGASAVRFMTLGLAWAARRRLLEEHGLYDACIVGHGDRAVICAAIGKFEYCEMALHMNSRQVEHYRAWAIPFFAAVGSKVGYIEHRALHLWHGDFKDRRYAQRHQDFRKFAFDPFVDIAPDGNGVWRWNTSKYEMHDYVRNYFESRNEDG